MRYQCVPKEIRGELYRHMKANGTSKLHYSYEPFFEAVVKKHRVCVFTTQARRHFNGVLVRDSWFKTISYTKSDPKVRQNFTKCHELAHLLLDHPETASEQVELEANRVAGFLLMPDIVLVSKILYRQDDFHQLRRELRVSAEALRIRLAQLLQDWTDCPYPLIKNYVRQYGLGAPEKYAQTLRSAEDLIVREFKRS